MPIEEPAEGIITLTKTKPDTLDRMRKALAEFAAKYDYALNGQAQVAGYSVTRYQIRSGLLVFTRPPNSRERPSGVGVSRRPDGTVVVGYDDGYGIEKRGNPVVADLKQLVVRHTRGEHVTYSRNPAKWRITGVGD